MASLSSKLNLQRLNVPPATKTLLLILTGLSLLLQFLKYRTYQQLLDQGEKNIDSDKIVVPYLQLIPNHTLLHPWTVLTSVFIDIKLWRYFLSFVVTFFSGKFVERSWSGRELIKFVVAIGSITNLLVSISIIFVNIVSGIDYFNIPVDGNLSILIAFLVVFKQLIPEHSIVLFKGAINARVKHVPFLTLIGLSIVSIVRASTTPFLQSWIGFFVSWTYLRFYQPNVVDPVLPQPNDVVGVRKLYGDASETFSLIHFFPDVLHPVLSPILNQFYETAIQLNIINRFNESDIEQGNLIANRRLTGHSTNSGANDARNAAERRRQVALKVLEERIGADDTSKNAEVKNEQSSSTNN